MTLAARDPLRCSPPRDRCRPRLPWAITLVAEPFFTPGLPLAFGRRGSVPAHAGELALVAPAPHGGRARDRRAARLAARPRAPCCTRSPPRAAPRARSRTRSTARSPRCRPTRRRRPATRRDLRAALAFTVDPGTAKDHDDAHRGRARRRRAARARPHRRRRGRRCRRAARSTPRRGGAPSRSTCPAASTRCCRRRCRPGSAACVPERPRDVVSVEVPFGPDLEPGRPSFLRAQIRSARRLSYEEVEAILAGGGECTPELRRAIGDADRGRPRAAGAPAGARRALPRHARARRCASPTAASPTRG